MHLLANRIFIPLLALLLAALHTPPISLAFFTQSPSPPPYADKIKSFMETQMHRYKIPGAALAIVRNGEVEYLAGFGVANVKGEPVTPDTPFLLASVSKSFTALGLMQLVEAGLLSLDDPVQKHLPWFQVAGEQGEPLTIAHLLYQTSGFSEIEGVRATLRPDSPDALETAVRELRAGALKFKPGEGWEYSNLNYDVLGLLIQQVSGQSYESYIQKNIFDPLGMTHSYTSLSEARANGAASGYYPFFGIPLVYDNRMPYSRATLPSAGLWSSVSDLSRYLIAHLNQGQYGEAMLLSAESAAQLHQTGYEWEPGSGYAMGWTRVKDFLGRDLLDTLTTDLKNYEHLPLVFHGGDCVNYFATLFFLPEQDFGVALLMNSNDPLVASAQDGFAWDVTLIANGGEAQYFPAWEENFLVQNSRWVFSLVVLLLVGEMVWSYRKWRDIRRDIRRGTDPAEPSRRTMLLHVVIPLAIDLALVIYLFLKLLPDNAVDLQIVLWDVPDVGLLLVAALLLSLAWGALRTMLFLTFFRFNLVKMSLK